MQLLDLPPEIIVRILCCLNLSDLASAIRVNHAVHNYFNTLQILQYRFALQAAAIEDNPHTKFVAAERLALLKSREEGWAQFRFDFRRTIPVRHVPSGVYDMTGGIYLLGDVNKRTLHYCMLPSKPDDSGVWTRIDIDHRLIDMGLSIHEHDLIAIVTTTPHQTHVGLHVIEIMLLQFSTGKPHPLARDPILFVAESHWTRPAIGIEIVGDHLALVTNYFLHHDRPDDHFYIYEWKTGTLKMNFATTNHTYSGMVFLSPDLILLPNTREKTFDVWSIPSTPIGSDTTAADASTSPASTSPAGTTSTPSTPNATVPPRPPPPPRPFLALSLPPIAPGQLLLTLSCRGEPNPTLTRTTPHCHQPFYASPADALVIFNLRLQHLGFARGSTFSMFVHRSALVARARAALARIETRARAKVVREEQVRKRKRREFHERDEEGNERSTLTTVDEEDHEEGEGNEYGDEDEDEDEDDAWPGQIRWDFPHGMMLVAIDAHGQPIPIHVRPPPHAQVWVGWEEWGPGVTRWFDAEDMPTRWITTSAGQRCVVSEEDMGMDVDEDEDEEGEGEERAPLKVLDFNPLSVRKAISQLEGEMDEDGDGTGPGERGKMKAMLAGDVIFGPGPRGGRTQREIVTAPGVLQHEAFEEPVRSGLPYVSLACWPPTGQRYDFAGVLMDEERLLGLRTDKHDTIVEIEVMHIGVGTESVGHDKGRIQTDRGSGRGTVGGTRSGVRGVP